MTNKEWSKELYKIFEDDALTLSGFGSKRNRGSSGTTPVDTHPDLNLTSQDDGKGKSSAEVGKSYGRENRPNEWRDSRDLPQQKGFWNPQQQRNYDLWTGAVKRDVDNRERSRRLQRPGNK